MALVPLAAELVLDKAIRDFKIETLRRDIDAALQAGDRMEFDWLVRDLKEVLAE